MYSTHIIKLKLILLWFIETIKCMITLCGTGETMKLFTCSKWSTHACLHPCLCHENCEFVKKKRRRGFWCTSEGIVMEMEFLGNYVGKEKKKKKEAQIAIWHRD